MIKSGSLKEFTSEKIKSQKEISEIIRTLKERGKKTGLCVGGYDLLHPGHMKHFESAKSLCDILMVGVTANKFVNKRKGKGRPIYDEKLRAYSVSQQISVDSVFISNYERATDVIKILKPNYYIKGPDFIKKNTPGIKAEREAIREVGGEMRYTSDEKISTTEIIRYVKDEIDKKSLLMILDRDGTIIEEKNFLGKDENWRAEIKLKKDVLDFIKYVDSRYSSTKLVATNQTGVARKMFSEKRVQEINSFINKLLLEEKILIDDWQYCPYADNFYVKSMKNPQFEKKYIKKKSGRKPDPKMVNNSLKKMNQSLEQFDKVLVLGDRKEDMQLAENLAANFINVKNKNFEEMIKSFRKVRKRD